MIKDLEGNDPIIACSTGSGHNTAIAVIRLSGFNFINDLQATFSVSLKKIRPRYVTRTKILRGNKVLDDALITYFPAPSSFTGENILELSVHGNQLLVMEILDTFCKYHGFRHAVPGEFSYRAYKNKKLTLNQIEGLDLLLNACSNFSKSQGLKILNGEIHEKFLELRTAYIELKSAVELKIDFSEDVGEEEADRLFFERNKKLKDLIEELYARTQGNNSNLLNPSVILIGKTNAGKSSLFNKILRQNRSIVSDIAGTTRDYVSEYVFYEGINFRIVDTAGLRETLNPIEKVGISRSYELFRHGFYKALVVNPLDFFDNDFQLVPFEDLDCLVLTHSDLPGFEIASKKLLEKAPKLLKILTISFGPIEPKITNGPMGAPDVLGLLKEASCKYQKLASSEPLLVERQAQLINKIYFQNMQFQDFINIDDIAILSSELSSLGASIEELIGVVSTSQILQSIFSNFCIGK